MVDARYDRKSMQTWTHKGTGTTGMDRWNHRDWYRTWTDEDDAGTNCQSLTASVKLAAASTAMASPATAALQHDFARRATKYNQHKEQHIANCNERAMQMCRII